MPTTAITTYSGKKLEPFYDPDLARTIAARLPASVTLARGTVLGEKTASPGTFGAYDAGNSDGTETARVILAFDVVTDASGLITLGDVSTGNELGEKQLTVPVYYQGIFKESELTGLDAGALEDMGGRYVHSGVVKIG